MKTTPTMLVLSPVERLMLGRLMVGNMTGERDGCLWNDLQDQFTKEEHNLLFNYDWPDFGNVQPSNPNVVISQSALREAAEKALKPKKEYRVFTSTRRYYTVQAGDTLSEIAEGLGVSVNKLVMINKMSPGQIDMHTRLYLD